MSTYYVRKTGNDSTGDGSTGAPWLTIGKALSTVSAAGGHTIKVGAGDYAEDTWSGTLLIGQTFSAMVVIEPESGILGDVTVHQVSNTNYGIYFYGDYVRFNKISFPITGSSVGIFVDIGASHFELIDCSIVHDLTGSPNKRGAVWIWPSSGTVSNIVISGCSIQCIGDTATACINIEARTNAVITGVLVQNCTFPQSYSLINVISIKSDPAGPGSVTGVDIEDCTIDEGVAYFVLGIGDDAAAQGNITDINITRCNITGVNHACAIEFGVNGCVIDDCTISSDIYGVVIKECSNVEVKNSTITSGSNSAVYFKAATSPNLHDCTVNASQGVGLRIAKNAITNHKCSNWQSQNNEFYITGTGAVFSIGNDDHDSGGGVSDYNFYDPDGSGLYGAVRNDASVADITELRSAWADYDNPDNDSHSNLTGTVQPMVRAPGWGRW